MLDKAPDKAGETILGPFEVAADAAAVAAFAAATGASNSGVPATFPIVWLSAPQMKQALRAAVGPDALPVHESQSFDYVRPLEIGGVYRLTATARREAKPDRLVIEAEAVTASGEKALAMRTALRIFPLTARAAQ